MFKSLTNLHQGCIRSGSWNNLDLFGGPILFAKLFLFSVSKNLLGDSVPIVYTCGVLHIEGNEKKYMKAGYGVYWPHAQELGTGRRYNFYPVTLVRCQLQAIIDALQQVTTKFKSVLLFSFEVNVNRLKVFVIFL